MDHPFAGDHSPLGGDSREDHSRYWSERYTGTISVVLKTRTPMFITDQATKTLLSGNEGQNNAHYCYGTLDYIPSTALKGMLSSAYEAITNSRYRVFSKKQHERKLGMRSQTNPRLVPGRVRNNGDSIEIELFTGTTGLTAGNPSPLYAAWLPMYTSPAGNIINSLNGTFQDGVTIRLYQHTRGFRFWSVAQIAGQTAAPITHHAAPVLGVAERIVGGYVVVSGKIFNRKHDERFFFNDPSNPLTAPVTADVKEDYEDLIADYQAVHEDGANPPIGSGVELGGHITNQSRKRLSDGDFVYAKMNGNNVAALFPVQISRELYKKSPRDCVYPSVLPADGIDRLSPAERLFGWVSQEKKGAWKGKIRISDSSKVQTECFEPIPLAVLGNPKPAQVRFYLGNQNGDPQTDGIPKTDGIQKTQAAYGTGKKLRGRKVYLNQQQPDENYWIPSYWKNNFAEYYMKIDESETEADRRSGQNRSISSWIPAGRELHFNIRVENLTREELGAMLTLFTLSTDKKEQCLNMGYAKPLGFGSFTLKLDLAGDDLLPICTGEQMRDHYSRFGDGFSRGDGLDVRLRREIINQYKKALVDAYGTPPPSSQMPDIPDSWKNCERAAAIISTEQEIKDFADNVWRKSFERDAGRLSFDDFSLAEFLEEKENGGASIAEELQEIYSQAMADYRKQVNSAQQKRSSLYEMAWNKIQFIADFLKFTRKYENVHYPRNSDTDKGYVWFAKNERQENNKLVHGYSLPPIGIELKETP
jgi:CRISPR-associated protein (TIGR03986 family)